MTERRRRSEYDYEWADEVVRRYYRRKHKSQQFDRAVADLKAAVYQALEPMLLWLSRRLPHD